MLSTAARANLTIVLVGARNPGNIGAAARAMQDFGFHDLRIVNDYAAPFEAAQLEAAQLESAQLAAAHPPKSAVGAASVMQQARRFSTLADAIADCTLIVGTTAIGERDLHRPIQTLQHATPAILQSLQLTPATTTTTATEMSSRPKSALFADAVERPASPALLTTPPRTALLFGSEKTGLTNNHLSHCQLLLTIPLFAPSAAAGEKPTRHLSMNLGQSVAVCLYELTREGFEASKDIPTLHEAPATAEDRERLTQLLLDVMHITGYTRRFPANATEPLVRQLTQQLGVTPREAMTWMGILRQILWQTQSKASQPKP